MADHDHEEAEEEQEEIANPFLCDLTPEDMAKGMDEATRFVAKTFLQEQHYQRIHQTLSSTWERHHSLSAAVKLMESYGVTLSAAEQQKLSQMDEAQQINKLVQKMPQENNEQFQQFFLQLQLLVSTAMRVRRALEAGQPGEVAVALEDADASGIASYILNVAIVQAGSEVKTLKGQFQSWTQEADSRMGRLLRGQTDAITAQKQLSQAQALLARQNGEHSAKSAKVVMNFVRGDDKAFVGLVLTGWAQVAKRARWEAQIRADYADRLQDLEDNLAKAKASQISKCECVVLRRIQQENRALLGHLYDLWKKDVDEAAFLREHGDKLQEMEARLAATKGEQRAKARKVMAGMATKSDSGLLAECLRGWIEIRLGTLKQQQAHEARLQQTARIDEFAKNKSEKTKKMIMRFAASEDTGLVHACMSSWIDFWAEEKQAGEVAEKMHKSQRSMESFSQRNKATSGSLMNRAAEHQVTLLLTSVLNAWRMDASLERAVRGFHSKVDAKRGQLVGVQQMFRNFAQQLESGLEAKGGGQDSSRLFDPKSKAKRMSKGEGAVSLPDIHSKQGSSRLASGRSGKLSSSGRHGDKVRQGSKRSEGMLVSAH